MLADDYVLGHGAAEHGYGVKLSSSFVTITCEEHRFSDFWKHQLRWARTYRTTRRLSLATILIHGPFWGLVLLIASRLNPFAIAAFAVLIAARLAMAAVITDKVLGMPELRRDLWLVPFKDLVMTAIYFTSLVGNEILWGGRRLEILADGTMREVSG
jgi:ceramide glucosyltransferase